MPTTDWFVEDLQKFLKENPIDYTECDNYEPWGGSLPGEKSPRWGMTNSPYWHEVMSERMSGEDNPFYGKKHTPEARIKMKEAAKRRAQTNFAENQRKALCAKNRYEFLTPEGLPVKITGSLNQFCKAQGLNTGAMSQVHLGKAKAHKGWRKG